MKLRTRLLILAACALVFLVAAPAIVFYALGYRLDFTTWKVTETGGIYVRAVPTGTTVAIDNGSENTIGLFSPSVFVQNLVPGAHTVSINKDGYYAYQKNLPVKEKEVTKLENVTLFQQDMGFVAAAQNVLYFSAAPDNATLLTAAPAKTGFTITIANVADIGNAQNLNTPQKTYSLETKTATITNVVWSVDSKKALVQAGTGYYLVDTTSIATIAAQVPYLTGATNVRFNPQNNSELLYIKKAALPAMLNVYSSEAVNPLLENVLAYQPQPNSSNIIWLAANGAINITNTQTLQTSLYVARHVVIKKGAAYNLVIAGGAVYLQENTTLLQVDQETNSITPVYASVKAVSVSPDGKKTVYYNEKEVVIGQVDANIITPETTTTTVLVPLFSGPVSDVWWVNNDYLAITSGNSVVISEIDARGNVNIITLSSITLADGTTVALQAPKLFFSQQDKKLYIVSQKTLMVSEKLLP